MKRMVLFMVLMALGSCATYAPKKYNELKFDKDISWPNYKIYSFVSKNKIKFFVIEDSELPLIRIQMYVKGGRSVVPSGKEGLDFILAQMILNGGTKKYPEEQFNVFLEDRAVEFYIDFDFLNAVVNIDLLSKDFYEVMPVILDSLAHPNFTKENFELAKKRLKSIIARRNDNQEEIGHREFKRIVYGKDSIYGRIPTYESVDNITMQDVLDFHKRLFVGSNLLVGIVGDLQVKDIKNRVLDLFSLFPKGQEVVFDFPEPPYNGGEKFIVDSKDSNQAFIILGHLGDYRLNPDYGALQVMNMVLSGGFSGRLFENIRTRKGLAYSVYSHFGCERYFPGIFFVALKTKNSSVTDAILAVIDELKKIKEHGCSAKEVEDAKEQFLNSIVFRYDSPRKVMERRLYYELRDMDPNSFLKLIDDIKKVSENDVSRVAKKYLDVDKLDILVVGDKKQLENELKGLGNWREWELD